MKFDAEKKLSFCRR